MMNRAGPGDPHTGLGWALRRKYVLAKHNGRLSKAKRPPHGPTPGFKDKTPAHLAVPGRALFW